MKIKLLVLTAIFLTLPNFLAAQTGDPAAFFELCPTQDPQYARWRQDFDFLRNGQPLVEVSCSEPISSMQSVATPDELRLLQSIRAVYYSSKTAPPALSWTNLSLYDWLKSKVAGFDIDDSATSSSCCKILHGKPYVTIRKIPVSARQIAELGSTLSMIALLAHEARHRDNFPHDSACGIQGGCDPVFDETNPSAYAVQFLLYKGWLSGTIPIGLSCLSGGRRQIEAASLRDTGNIYVARFSNAAPLNLAVPEQPGGTCIRPTPTNCFLDWAEIAYEKHLGEFRLPTLYSQPYDYRHYKNSAYAGVSRENSHVYYLGPAYDMKITDLGHISGWLTRSACVGSATLN